VSRLVVTGGRFHRYSLDGQHVPSVTTLAGVLDKPGLMYGAAKETAIWAAAHVDDLAARGEDAWRRDAQRAFRDKWDESGRVGTQVHTIAERLVWGDEVPDEDDDGLPWPDDVRRMGEQVAKFMDKWDVDPLLVESPVFHEDLAYAGRLDLVAHLRDGHRWLIDYKTGASGVYPEVALQLAGYANCTHFQRDDEDVAMPTVQRFGALWVRPDAWELQPITVTEGTWRVFNACRFIYENWARLKAEDVVGAALPPPQVAS
jgi:hypothetical protein